MSAIAIHGFGRIGRVATRIALKNSMFVPVSISDIKDPAMLISLFSVDTNYGVWPEEVKYINGKFSIGDREIYFFNTGESLPDWNSLGVDVVIDCTSGATIRKNAEAHLERGANRVLVSASSKSLKDCDAVLLPGINLDNYDPSRHHIISMASCTTNALAPVVKILMESFGIERGFFSAVHSYTINQSLTDQPLEVRRDSWAATENIIPSSSGAAKALQFIWPGLPITGKSYRVPTSTGSIVELVVQLKAKADLDEIKNIFRKAAAGPPLQGIMGVLEEEFASCRIIGEYRSSIVDIPLIQLLDGSMLSVAAWYDNEMGYATRLVETAKLLSRS